MVRLTFEGNYCDISQCRELPCKYDGNCTQRLVWERLKAYEDAGLSPQACAEAREIEETLSSYDYSISRMVELMKADKDGRVLIPPCKVGDTVYFANAKHILEFTVVGYAVDETGISWVYSEHVDKTGHTYERTFSPDRIGKTTFLSREEAEKALQEMEGKKDGNKTSM